jgi:acyl-coenzyme A synthetase/AMP-(fatty) acid ligase
MTLKLMFYVVSMSQVKVNGFRIELAEVEMAISACERVRQAVVIVRQGQLAAYVNLTNESSLEDKTSIRRELLQVVARSLPHYMLPRL